jgi:lipopolysaccharide export system protein LptC
MKSNISEYINPSTGAYTKHTTTYEYSSKNGISNKDGKFSNMHDNIYNGFLEDMDPLERYRNSNKIGFDIQPKY